MEKIYFENTIREFVNSAPGNFVAREIALRPELAGMRIFEEPLFGYAAADDPLFSEYKKPGIIGAHFLLPLEWLPEAQTVLSIFFPFTQQIKKANQADMSWPASEWLHGRIEGQQFQGNISLYATELLKKDGFAVLVPASDSRFSSKNPLVQDKSRQDYYTSNWSERHAAYVCGLGTFSLSKGLITAKGIAGRFISLITSAPFEPGARPYTKFDEYCIRCGACASNCPAGAISMEKGKNHPLCSAFIDRTMEKHKPRYGCGKCQVNVPCESGIPGAR
ncbi:(Fe-S)-binding protein [Spirochaetia bacterium]|nr:(Fe-S)-binding protein [Spirochaetia bacterium]